MSAEPSIDRSDRSTRSRNSVPDVQVESREDNGLDVSLTLGDRAFRINLSRHRNHSDGPNIGGFDAGVRGSFSRSNSSIVRPTFLPAYFGRGRVLNSASRRDLARSSSLHTMSEGPSTSIESQGLRNMALYPDFDLSRSTQNMRESAHETFLNEVLPILTVFGNEFPQRPENFGNQTSQRPVIFGGDVPQRPEDFSVELPQRLRLFGNEILRRTGDLDTQTPRNGDPISGVTRGLTGGRNVLQELSTDANISDCSAINVSDRTDKEIRAMAAKILAMADIPFGDELDEADQ